MFVRNSMLPVAGIILNTPGRSLQRGVLRRSRQLMFFGMRSFLSRAGSPVLSSGNSGRHAVAATQRESWCLCLVDKDWNSVRMLPRLPGNRCQLDLRGTSTCMLLRVSNRDIARHSVGNKALRTSSEFMSQQAALNEVSKPFHIQATWPELLTSEMDTSRQPFMDTASCCADLGTPRLFRIFLAFSAGSSSHQGIPLGKRSSA